MTTDTAAVLAPRTFVIAVRACPAEEVDDGSGPPPTEWYDPSTFSTTQCLAETYARKTDAMLGAFGAWARLHPVLRYERVRLVPVEEDM